MSFFQDSVSLTLRVRFCDKTNKIFLDVCTEIYEVNNVMFKIILIETILIEF